MTNSLLCFLARPFQTLWCSPPTTLADYFPFWLACRAVNFTSDFAHSVAQIWQTVLQTGLELTPGILIVPIDSLVPGFTEDGPSGFFLLFFHIRIVFPLT